MSCNCNEPVLSDAGKSSFEVSNMTKPEALIMLAIGGIAGFCVPKFLKKNKGRK